MVCTITLVQTALPSLLSDRPRQIWKTCCDVRFADVSCRAVVQRPSPLFSKDLPISLETWCVHPICQIFYSPSLKVGWLPIIRHYKTLKRCIIDLLYYITAKVVFSKYFSMSLSKRVQQNLQYTTSYVPFHQFIVRQKPNTELPRRCSLKSTRTCYYRRA